MWEALVLILQSWLLADRRPLTRKLIIGITAMAVLVLAMLVFKLAVT